MNKITITTQDAARLVAHAMYIAVRDFKLRGENPETGWNSQMGRERMLSDLREVSHDSGTPTPEVAAITAETAVFRDLL